MSTFRELNAGLIYLGAKRILDSTVGNVAKNYNVPNMKPYIISIQPETGGPYIQGGSSHIIIGMEYADHQYGFQASFGIGGIKYRGLEHGTWNTWKSFTMQ